MITTAGIRTAGVLGLLLAAALTAPAAAQQSATGDSANGCAALPSYSELKASLKAAVAPGNKDVNGGLANNEWVVVVDRGGIVCHVVTSGEPGQQWPGSRGIAAAKAFTANGFSLPGFAMSTANLYWPSQPEHPLSGTAQGNPLSASVLYKGAASTWGTPDDPLVGQRVGGTIAFGGGLPLYNADGKLVGGLGASGDTSCTDHVIAWKVRSRLNLDNVPKGVTQANDDNIIFDLTVDPATGEKTSASGYGHPICGPYVVDIARKLSTAYPTGPQPQNSSDSSDKPSN